MAGTLPAVAPSGPLTIPEHLTRGAPVDRGSTQAVLWLIEHMCAHVGIPDLAAADVLDMGCGVKFTTTILNEGVPVKRYVGVDVFKEMIEFLQANVDDPRFEFQHVDLRNERYNPDGAPLSSVAALPLADGSFDLICLFSVFTHLAPDDFREMLRVLRPLVRPDGKLFFSLYIDEVTPDGYGYIDSVVRMLDARPDLLDPDAVTVSREPVPFRDVDPDEPLRIALYSEEHAREPIEGTGWRVVKLLRPGPHIQHSFVCTPVPPR